MQDRVDGGHSNGHDSTKRVKVPTVQEALPYTPFTSILPFETSMIQMPAIGSIHSDSIRILDTDQLQTSRSILQNLSAGAERADSASAKCQATLADVKRILQSSQLNLQFRKPIDRAAQQQPSAPNKPKLSSFAQLVFDSVDLNQGLKQDRVKQTIPTTLTLDQPISKANHSTAKNTPAAARPAVDASATHVVHTTADAQDNSHPQTSNTQTVHVDEKAKGQTSLNTLRALLKEVFAADDAIASGDDITNEALTIFRFQDVGPSRLLSPACQSRLENAVTKCVSAVRLDSVSLDDLRRLQKLCKDVIELPTEPGLRLQEGWSEIEVEQWEQALVAAEGSLQSSRIVLKIMAASSSEQELQSEDLLKALLKAVRNIAENCIVSIVELHGNKQDSTTGTFAMAQDSHDQLVLVLRGFTKTMRALTALLGKVRVDEVAISTIVYVCKIILFAENTSHERDSILGVQTFESSRRYSMDLLARIFDKYPEQRQFIFDEVLLSLEKLPATKQNARQYRPAPDVKPIQLVSALIMQLVQTSATRGGTSASQLLKDGDEDESGDEDAEGSDDETSKADTGNHDASSTSLRLLTEPLSQASQGNALYVTNVLIQRALNTSKSADEPHRKLLDIFTDDFLAVLGVPEWPSAELLLRSLLRRMIAIIEGPKSTIPARNFALESLGKMGSGILDMQQQAQRRSQDGPTGLDMLRDILMEALEGGVPDPANTLSLRGPYRTIAEYLAGKSGGNIRTSLGFHLLQWSQQVIGSQEKIDGQSEIESTLQAMLANEQWLETHNIFNDISGEEARTAMLCIAINSPFCRAFPKIFNVLLTNVFNEHSTVKSRSLKSINNLIETDPSILDRNSEVLRSILRCMHDASSLVRDSALGLVAKCMTLQTQLDVKVFEHVIKRLEDSAVNVKKRAIKMLKELYLRNTGPVMRTAIATALIRRVRDDEESIVDLIKQVIEDIWFEPFYQSAMVGASDASATVLFQAQTLLLVRVVEASDEVPDALVAILEDLLLESKRATDNKTVTTRIVECLFDILIDDTPLPEKITQGMVLQVLAVIAQASPKLLTASQLQLLDTYTKNLSSNEDLTIFRLALTILRHAMPHTTGLQKKFLSDLQSALMGTLGKLPNSEFSEVAVCLWTINSTLKNTEKLVNIIIAAVSNIRALIGKDISDAATMKKLTRLMCLAGQFGKACDFEAYVADVKKKIVGAKASTVAGIIVESLAAFADPEQPLVVRQSALESICAVSLRWPKQFLRADVGSLFDSVLQEREQALENVFLDGMLTFFTGQEANLSSHEDPEDGATGRERLAKTYVATDQDGATAALSQRYLQQILRLATSSTDDSALHATKLISSIVRQGLPHPKECGPSLIALETSPNHAIARIACAEHRNLHEKHETIIEKEYMRAMERALQYQQVVCADARGWTAEQPASAKLCFFWDVLKAGKAKVRQKYLTNVCLKLVFEPTTTALAQHFTFVRFITGNLAFFDYDRMEDLRLLVDSLGKSFATVGIPLAQRIETEVFDMTVESLSSMPSQDYTGSANNSAQIDPERLHTLASAAQILLLIAETRAFLLRIWGGPKLLKKSSKDSKSLTRSTHTPAMSEAYIKRMEELAQPIGDELSQRAVCQTFSEVLSTDHEAKVEEEMGNDEAEDEAIRSPSATPSGRKRKLSVGTGPPKKRSKARKTPSFNRYDDDEDAEGELDD